MLLQNEGFWKNLTNKKTVDNLQVTLKTGATKNEEIQALLHSSTCRCLYTPVLFNANLNKMDRGGAALFRRKKIGTTDKPPFGLRSSNGVYIHPRGPIHARRFFFTDFPEHGFKPG